MTNSLMSQQFNNPDPIYFLTEVQSYYSSDQSLPFDYTLNWPDYPGQALPVATIRLLPEEPFYLGQRLWFTGFQEAHEVQQFISVYRGTQQEMVIQRTHPADPPPIGTTLSQLLISHSINFTQKQIVI
ncbi:hypothetical protein Clacol_006426 [Clathrus columnatus]|uniref:Uncharacterized protein n=1 Tax=Clathrus columnatus TaxID=1419009 RepID=A0AAV5AH15_9AGAM|nr:hypothetical protein Clacol_006426 [Clathrus columnatus]